MSHAVTEATPIPHPDYMYVKLLANLMRSKKFVKSKSILQIELFIYICLMKFHLKLSVLQKKPELEVEVLKLLGQLYEMVTSMLEKRKPKQEIASSGNEPAFGEAANVNEQ